MKKKTVHLIYSLPCNIFDKATMRLWKRLLFHPGLNELQWPTPIKAPLSITYNVARNLLHDFEVKLYDLREHVTITPLQGDILIGHPLPDPKSAIWRALDDRRFEEKYLLCPYNHSSDQISWLRPAIEKCDKYFAICGDYWMDTFSLSPFADLRHKIVHVNMALSSNDYPYLKKRFNPINQRRFFYVGRYGRFGDEKGIALLERLADNIPGFSGGYICEGGHIKGWHKISEPIKLTPEFIANLAGSYDFFINMSRADAQATTVLEAMSWGFPVACTKETGYSDNGLFLLDIDDVKQNVAAIEQMQNLPDDELHQISQHNRMVVETKYSWQHFNDALKMHIDS